MSWHVVFLIAGALLLTAGIEVARIYRLRPFLQRPYAGIRWHRRFPNVPHDDIRGFLSTFGTAFGFNDKQRSLFSPEDRVMDAYNAMNPPHVSIDALELEIFAQDFQQQYGIDLEDCWCDEITLGDLFQLTRAA